MPDSTKTFTLSNCRVGFSPPIPTKFLLLLCTCALVLFNIASPAQAKYGGGTGEPDDPYLIFDANQMNAIGADSNDWDKHFLLCADIDLSGFTGTAFNIIGTFWRNPFIGVFDGSDHTISNFSYTSKDTHNIGLFGYVGGLIKDLGLIDPNVDARTGNYVGSLVGRLIYGTVTNCYIEGGSVVGEYFVGGLVGGNEEYGTITNCYTSTDVSGSSGVGGLVGDNEEGTITNSYSSSDVSGTSYAVGGLVGRNHYATITNCYSTGSVTGDNDVGGLVGYNWGGEVTNSFWDIETSGQSTSAGGTGKTTAEMQMAGTFIDWGCGSVWTIDEGADYPRLAWENAPGEPITIPSELYGGGSGEPNDPYLIYTAEQLNTIGLVPCSWDRHFKLMADIDLAGFTGTEFNIIGYYVAWNDNKPFTGVFDGNGQTISNFTYSSTDKSNIGLFGYIDDTNAEIKDLGLIDPDVDAGTGRYVGSLVGSLRYGTISNCYVEGGSVSGESYVGGMVGNNFRGTITNCYSTGSVTGNWYVGGLVGYNSWGTISNCYSTGSVVGTNYVGGLVGRNWRGEVNNSFWDIETSGQMSSDGGTGLPTAQMKDPNTFIDAGWDFNTPVWTIDEGVDYPRLWWETPVLHAEPEVTLGTSNTISWDPVPRANDYYAECAEDANFTNILYNSGWITETSFEFTGLETGKRYWYSVKARNAAGVETGWSNVESSLQVTLADAVAVMLDPDTLKNKNLKNALLNKINAVQQMIADGFYADALNKLENDILQKTDGCAETGRPDKNDWIITCQGQEQIYPLVIETIENVKGLMNQ